MSERVIVDVQHSSDGQWKAEILASEPSCKRTFTVVALHPWEAAEEAVRVLFGADVRSASPGTTPREDELTGDLCTAIRLLALVKEWRDSDGNEPFPHRLRERIEEKLAKHNFSWHRSPGTTETGTRERLEELAAAWEEESTYIGARTSYQGAAVEVLKGCASRLRSALAALPVSRGEARVGKRAPALAAEAVERLLGNLATEEALKSKSNSEIGALLLDHVWAGMELGSAAELLVSEAASRLAPELDPSASPSPGSETPRGAGPHEAFPYCNDVKRHCDRWPDPCHCRCTVNGCTKDEPAPGSDEADARGTPNNSSKEG